ncbi:Flp pilus assembly protein TadG [Devosia crocina]|uniref:Flp pilus assembly protein TadG n=1 Tax=Devosia crocina TaxID=429728 RepID=A0A1I7MVY7_9HYPH|nr:TadE/TadG family type IV pilus assembly protein [Devosia crocina]SFV26555.1 Flp pilus assembly protein TadG [Devosia crocina]
MHTFKRLLQDQQGNVAIIVAFLILPMLVLAGGATDIARYEMFRAQLQDGVDRAVLASASLTQREDVRETAEQYLKTVDFIGGVDLDFDTAISLNQRKVTITGRYNMPTSFLPLIGIETLPIVATATALEQQSNIELSLMLDISGSMNDNGKFPALKTAATDFIRTMVTPETRDFTTVNMVPYAGQVSLGRAYFNDWGGIRLHQNSSCVELIQTDFYLANFRLADRQQAPHFTRWNSSTDKPVLPANMNPGWCPSEETSITLMSNNANALTSKIAGMRMHDGTGTAIAMVWGLRFLDPAMRPRVRDAIAKGYINSEFYDRPADFLTDGTLKVMVLMTDGAITEQYTAKNPNADVRTHNNWKYFYDPIWKRNLGSGETKQMMNTVCAEAKRRGVVIFTIGFQLSDSNTSQLAMKNDLRNCATSSAHYYDVRGLDIASAFRAIASNINSLKLTQ